MLAGVGRFHRISRPRRPSAPAPDAGSEEVPVPEPPIPSDPITQPFRRAIEPNTFGTHEFVDLCRRIKAEPSMCLNSLASTQESLDWVAYCNATESEFAEMRTANGHPDPFNVKFWSVGNERYDKVTVDRVRDVSMELRRLSGPQAHVPRGPGWHEGSP